jgi:PAS domain S-box-containing protein
LAGAFLLFIHWYPNRLDRKLSMAVLLFATPAPVLAFLSLMTQLVVRGGDFVDGEVLRTAGPLYPGFAIYIVGAWVMSFTALTLKWRRASGRQRIQLRYLGLGVLISVAGGVTTNLLLPFFTGKSTYSWAGPWFTFSLIILVAHAIIRHRLMELTLFIHRGLTIVIATIMSLVPVAMLVMLLWPRLSRDVQPTEVFGLLLATALVALLVPVTRDVAEALLDRYVYRRHADFRRTIKEASRILTGVLDLGLLFRFIEETVHDSTQPEGFALYIRQKHHLKKRDPARSHPGTRFHAPDQAPDVLVSFLDVSPDVIVTENLSRLNKTAPVQTLHAELTRLNWALVLPVLSENAVIGAIVLGPKLSGDPFYPQDLDLLMTLANQAGIAIKNAQLYADVVLANEYIENIVATINSGVVAVDAAGQITMVNPTAEQLTGLAAHLARGQHLSVLPACLGDALAVAVRDGVSRTEPEIALPDGTTSRPVICTTSPLRDQAGGVLGAVAVFSDLTPVKELEVERRRAERVSYLESVAAAIAHEVKNPLVAIKTFAQLIPRRRDDSRFIEDFGRVVYREIRRMERLVDRLRILSRPAQRPLHIVNVRQPLMEALEFMQPAFEERRVTTHAMIEGDDLPVLGDHGEIEQLFLNLLINALEATPLDGTLTVRLSCDGGHARIEVADTGPGIPTDILDRVFDPFFTTKQRGSGLGLAVCRGIAEAHHAKLSAANGAGGGAVFAVEFPTATSVAAPATS